MNRLSEKIEKIILQHGARGMDRLQKSMEPGYCRRAAQMILDNQGVVVIGTGFPVSGSFESDGPISAISPLPGADSPRLRTDLCLRATDFQNTVYRIFYL